MLWYPPMLGPTLSFSSSHLSGLNTSASLPQIFLFLGDELSHEIPYAIAGINLPVIGGKREDEISSFWQWDLGNQGSGLRLDGLEEWQDVVLPRPTYDVVYRGVETEVFL